jgi:hypothetical protein
MILASILYFLLCWFFDGSSTMMSCTQMGFTGFFLVVNACELRAGSVQMQQELGVRAGRFWHEVWRLVWSQSQKTLSPRLYSLCYYLVWWSCMMFVVRSSSGRPLLAQTTCINRILESRPRRNSLPNAGCIILTFRVFILLYNWIPIGENFIALLAFKFTRSFRTTPCVQCGKALSYPC